MSLRPFAAVALLALIAAPARAQRPGPSGGPPETVDRVVAVVGDSVVLESEVKEDMLRRQMQDSTVADTTQLRNEILQQRIDDLVLLQAAAADSTQVGPTQVQQAVDRDVAQRLQQNFGGSQSRMDAALAQQGMTTTEFRSLLSRQYERTLTIQQYMSKIQQTHEAPTVTEEEIDTFFTSHADQLGEKPATVTFRQVVLAPQASDSARSAAFRKAADVLAQIRNGADFAQLAKRYSDDPGTRDRGGDLGWFRRGQMVREFEDAAFALPAGGVSGIVETPYGFHIIKVEKVRGPERQARHILISIPTSPDDMDRTKALADSLAAKVRNGVSIDSLADRYGDPSEQARVGPYPVDQLPAPYDEAMKGVSVGEVVGPLELAGQGQTKFAVVKVTGVSPAGPYTVDDLRARIRQQIQQKKLVDEIISDLRKKTYIDVRN